MYFQLIASHNFEEIKPAWAKLHNSLEAPCIFYHPLFLQGTSNLLVRNRPSHMVLGYKDDNLIFGLPCTIRNRGTGGIVSYFYHPPHEGWDHLEPLDQTKDLTATRYLIRDCKKIFGWDLFVADHTTSRVAQLFELYCSTNRAFTRNSFKCPYKLLPPDSSDLTTSLSKHFRTNIRQDIKRAKDLGITFVAVRSQAEMAFSINNLIALHELRSDSTGRSSRFTAESQAYHRRLAELSVIFPGIVSIFELRLADTVIASLYGFCHHHRFYFYQCGIETGYTRLSLGNLLIYNTMSYLIDNGVRIFDFLRGTEDYKFKWTDTLFQDYFIMSSHSRCGKFYLEYDRWRRAIKRYGKKVGTMAWFSRRDH